MTDAERREAARQFYQKWHGKGKEDEDDRSYWLDILQRIMGAGDATDRIEFQKKVIVDGHTKRIDAYIPETKIIIEQKTLGIALDKKIAQSGGVALTPYEQAKRYNDHLPSSEKARWIVTSNFAEIWVYDMDTRVPEENITKISIKDLQSHYMMLDFLLEKSVKKVSKEVEISKEAGTLVGRIYEAFLKQYHKPDDKKTLESLNILCVRLVFCLYAEDAALLGKQRNLFSEYIKQYEPKDLRQALIQLFEVLDTPIGEREDMYLSDELERFPYVNGGLFSKNETVIIPKITQEIKDILLEAALFDWRKISPTIFGAVFESTLNPETRRSGGMHYTSIENIHKVIDPLFLDELREELADILRISVDKTRERKLRAFQDKLAGLTFLDPACGSGNFLTETYVSLRRLENDVLRELSAQIMLGDVAPETIKVSISQFYGIEINDFAADVAKTALWIAESQMMKETEDIFHMELDFLPLKNNVNIVEGNALTLDWESVVPKDKLDFIFGNPPFLGFKFASDSQKADMKKVFANDIKPALLDYVTCWYKKAAEYIQETFIQVAFVSTNSICQGQMAGDLWPMLLDKYSVKINFAWRSFVWESESKKSASVHVVIVGFAFFDRDKKCLYTADAKKTVSNISPYLTEGANILITSRKIPLYDVPLMTMGNQAMDGGNLIIEEKDYDEFIATEPKALPYIKRYMMGYEFINNKKRYCLWLVNCSPSELRKMPYVMERVKAVQEIRANSNDAGARRKAETPTLFREQRNPKRFIAVPIVSSERRRYIPIGYLDDSVIAGNKLFIIPEASLYHFGVLTSNVHMAWMRTVAARLKSDYTYSKDIVYNNFPWPEPTEAQKAKIEKTAQGILDARALYPDSSLADLYDPLTMPRELLKAHQANDRAVMEAYGLDVKTTSEADCVAFLMKRYQELTSQ